MDASHLIFELVPNIISTILLTLRNIFLTCITFIECNMRTHFVVLGIVCLLSISCVFSQPTLTITEIHYNSDSTRNTGDWFELYNYGNTSIDLSLFRIRDSSATGLYLVPSGTIIGAQQYLVFCADLSRFDTYYSIPNRMGDLGFGLNNKTDGIRIFDASNNLILELFYTDSLPWPPGADGYGRTLEIIDPALNPALPSSWRTGCILGSPGTAFSPCYNETIVVSEINYKSSPTQDAGDWFEIRNIGNASVDISNYRVRDSKNKNMYIIPANTILAPQASVAVFNTPAKFNNRFPWVSNKVGPFIFNLSGAGDCIRLYNADDKVIFSVCYGDDAPWPEEPDGNGYTLEADTNFYFNRDVNDASSWFAGCPEGSPSVKYTPNCNVSIEALEYNPFYIYPNPTSDQFFIYSANEKPSEIAILDINGKLVYTIPFSETVQIQTLSPGLYFLQIKTQKQTYYSKILKRP